LGSCCRSAARLLRALTAGNFLNKIEAARGLAGQIPAVQLGLHMQTQILFLKGDITDLAVDAIVNAANTDLILGAGVAGAIRRKGGPRIQEECARLAPVPLGGAAVTTGGNLKALYVIHAASMHLGGSASAESLRAATRNALERAEEKSFHTIAFPAIGTGIAGFPMEECARIMIGAVLNHVKSRTTLEKVYFVLFDDDSLNVFQKVYKEMAPSPGDDMALHPGDQFD
jgi:O-acetyl-ADP-ribose deacetylase (regulator of RNase III)